MSSERPAIYVMRRGEFLLPQAPVDGERIRELPAGKTLKATFVQPRRSNPQLRLYWSMLSLVCDNLDQDIDAGALHDWLKLKLGLVTYVRQRNGGMVTVPKSIAFDKMEHHEFNAYFDKVKTLLIEHLIPGLSSAALEREARAMLGEISK